MEETRRRQPLFAVLLSLILPGLGHVYCGKPVKGIASYIGLWLVIVTIGLSGLINSVAWFIGLVVIAVVLQAAVAVDAGLAAYRLREIPLSWFHRWYVYLLVVIAVHLVIEPVWVPILQYRIVGLRTFRVPDNSMNPALIAGDCFLAKVGHYAKQSPNRGDIVIFPYPPDPAKTFVKRVIGLPGERLRIKEKLVFINDSPLVDPWGIHTEKAVLPASTVERDNFGPITIPQDSVFVMGDNREHSLDSRFVGCIRVRDIGGKALFIYRSPDRSRIDMRLD